MYVLAGRGARTISLWPTGQSPETGVSAPSATSADKKFIVSGRTQHTVRQSSSWLSLDGITHHTLPGSLLTPAWILLIQVWWNSCSCRFQWLYFTYLYSFYLRQEVLRSVTFVGWLVGSFVSLLTFSWSSISKTVGDEATFGSPIWNGIWRIKWSPYWNSRWRPGGALHSLAAFGWLSSVVVRASDLWSRGREFNSRPVHCRVA